jgi:thiosulfate/3-mercaptopyruvate sulfurtransferase
VNSRPLIEPAELADLLRAERPPVLADVRWALTGPPGRPEFEAGHLPGAQWVDLERELSGPAGTGGSGGRHPLPAPEVLQAALRRIGVDDDSTVVVYDAATSLAAARMWWLLTDAGLTDVRVLNGGFAAWQAAGLPVARGPAVPAAPGRVTVRAGHRDRASAEQVAELLAAGRPVVDVRAADRYAGRNEVLDPVAGHIPGAVSRPSPGNHDEQGRFLPSERIRSRFADLRDPVLYCGSGITAAQTLLALESAGLSGVIYPGSWSDWITDPDRPVATGAQPRAFEASAR